MARLSKEYHAAVERAKTPVKSPFQNRFTNIFKSSPRKSPRSSVDSIDKGESIRPRFVKAGLHPEDKARLSDGSLHSPLTMPEVKPQELTAPTAADKAIDATGNTDAEQLVREWQAELEEKKEEKKGQQMTPTKLLYGRRNTIDEMLDVGSNWFSHSRDDEKKKKV
jgi:hypothetical protein